MNGLGRRDQGSAGRRLKQRASFIASGAVAGVLAAGLTFWVAPVIGEGTNEEARPNTPMVLATVPATESQLAGTKFSGAVISANRKAKKAISKRVSIESRITDSEAPLVTAENSGTFVGIKCPKGSLAISGGVQTSYINLLISNSAPNHLITGKYTPRTWWVAVTNARIDDQGGSLSWRGVVNCMSPFKLKR